MQKPTKFRMVRIRRGLTLKELADLSKINIAKLSYLERGATPNVNDQIAISHALGVSIKELFDERG